MDLIQPVCREQMNQRDIAYIASVIAGPGPDQEGERGHVRDLMQDPSSRDVLLDEEALLRALLETPEDLHISVRLYFYVLVRHALKQHGVEDREIADYVSELLAECTRSEEAFTEGLPIEYLSDWMARQAESDPHTGFGIMVYLSNHCLFMTGMFAPYLHAREDRRGAPGLAYYEHTGRMGFRQAADHRLARHHALQRVFYHLSDCFKETRQAMNGLADRLTFLGEPAVAAGCLDVDGME